MGSQEVLATKEQHLDVVDGTELEERFQETLGDEPEPTGEMATFVTNETFIDIHGYQEQIQYSSETEAKFVPCNEVEETEHKSVTKLTEKNADIPHVENGGSETFYREPEQDVEDTEQFHENVEITPLEHGISLAGPGNLKQEDLSESGEITQETTNLLFGCDQCSYKAKQKSNLRAHRNIHTGNIYSCTKCPFETKWKESLERHLLMEAGVKHACNECEYKAHDKRNIKKHILTKHEGFRFKCDQCDYTCKIHKSLVKHKNGSHHGKLSNCGQCEFSSVLKSNLKRHIKENHSGLGYRCHFCEVLY